ncbi:hypothetical protein DX914_10745 [Lysobacter silvisoli]|uniref:Uncharacterized protein n=1 Tax=Lysobacter silvisoli TaxID=2293254 RepID=A0A371K6P3_9GAMM|nr:hypothetical protein DX914_10745 [Lysobacter silvisoli]
MVVTGGAYAASVQPQTYTGNFTGCDDLPGVGTWKGSGASSGSAPTEGQVYNLGNGQTITFNYTPGGQSQYIGFSATIPMDYIVVKGGSSYNVFHYDPAVNADIELYSPNNGSGEPAGVSHVAYCFLPKPTASKTATAQWQRYTDWQLDKSVTPQNITLFDGDSHQVEYTVSAVPTSNASYQVSGTITVKDPFDFGWQATAVVDKLQFNNNALQFPLTWTAQGGDVDTLTCVKPAANAQHIILSCDYSFNLSSISYPFLLTATGGVNAVGVTAQAGSSCGCGDDGSDGESAGSPLTHTMTALAQFAIPGSPSQSYGDTLSLDDSMLPNAVDHSFSLGNGPYVWKYPRPQPFTCNADEGQHTNNVAGSWSTGANTSGTAYDSATVTVACRTVSISKTAETSYNRDYAWAPDKKIVATAADGQGKPGCAADPIVGGPYDGSYLCDDLELMLNPGGNYQTVYYLSAVRSIESETGFAVDGNIQVSWPAGVTPQFDPAQPVDTLHFDDNTTQAVSPTCGAQGATSLSCTYHAALSGRMEGYNEAVINRVRKCYDAQGVATDCGTRAYTSNQAALNYSEPNVETDRCVLASDLFNSTAGLNLGAGFGWTVAAQVCDDFSRYVTGDINPDPNIVQSLDVLAAWILPSQVGAGKSCEFMVPNVLLLSSDNGANKSDEAVLTVNVPRLCENAGGCTYTQGYWKTHSKYGPAPYDATWAKIGEDTLFFSSGQTWYMVFKTPPKGGNAYYQLAHQYMAARLNVAAGASTTPQVASAIAQSTAWFTGRSSAAPKGAARDFALDMASLLAEYNEGGIGPGHCSVSPVTVAQGQ